MVAQPAALVAERLWRAAPIPGGSRPVSAGAPQSRSDRFKVYQIGLRTLELRQEQDQWGRSFVFVVNGVPIFAKGSNWIPADSFPTRITADHLEDLIRSAAETHQNMLRVWGGGFYEEERFYDLCDRYGILVWQEFIFSCSIYPLDDPEFLENVRVEVVQNVRRLRHRASLALWCGNNEMEWGWVEWGWNRPDLQDMKAAYDQFFHHTSRPGAQLKTLTTPIGPARLPRILLLRTPTASARAMPIIGMCGMDASRLPRIATNTRAS